MEILVVRHGESLGDIEDRHEGRADFPLTELGCQQALYESQVIVQIPLNIYVHSKL